jgi:hypothetical protein
MISNRFYYCFTLLATIFILSSCLDSNDNERIEYDYSSDAQITALAISSNKDSLKVLPSVQFSINQVASAPIIFNRDSLPYLFNVKMVKMDVKTNGASGIKIHLANDSTYIWNKTDSVLINELKHLEVFAANGVTTKMYNFKLNTHQQDPDTIYWQNVTNNYINLPTDQATVANASNFYTYYKVGSSVGLSTSPIVDGETWTDKPISGLPASVVLKSIQIDSAKESEMWYALNADGKVYLSANGLTWTEQSVDLPVNAVYGKLPSFSTDSILAVVKDGDKYKFAKTMNFTSMNVLNEIPTGFPVEGFTFTRVNNPLIYTAKYLIVTGGKDINGLQNSKVWVLQEGESKITYTSKSLNFNVKGASMFNYDNKIYMLTSEEDKSKEVKNVFYTSSNYGLVWSKANSKQALPAGFSYRENMSISVDIKNNIWIFGGVSSNEAQLVEIWKGRINKLYVK